MTDLDALEKAAKAATPGPWEADVVPNFGEYGSGDETQTGFDSYALFADGKAIADSINSDTAFVEEEHDVDHARAWDEVARLNFEFMALANPATILALIADRRALLIWVERYERALVEIRDREARAILPWTHEQAADEYARMLDADRTCARAALGGAHE